MHNVAVALERHQFVHLHSAVFRDTANIVTGEVNEHDVLGTLLRMFDQLGSHQAIVLVVLSAAARPGNRTRDNLAIE